MKRLRVGLYGSNGHQVHGCLAAHPRADLVACAGLPDELVPALAHARRHASLDEMLAVGGVDLVVLCSPRRADQGSDAIACLRAGAHVLAEKPAVLVEAELDRVLAAASAAGRRFHEMAGTAFRQPYLAMREAVASGAIGAVVQVLVQKSYPWHDRRPHDEAIDGGLLRQVGIHAVRLVEHVAGERVAAATAIETALGSPAPHGVRMASALQLTLASGGIASAIANYLNPPAFGSWSNEHLRIFGTRGMVESVDGGLRTRLLADGRDGPLLARTSSPGWFDLLVGSLLDGTPMPFDSEDELHPLRVVLRAKAAVEALQAPPAMVAAAGAAR